MLLCCRGWQRNVPKCKIHMQRPQIALTLLARATLIVFEKFTRAYLFQIALEIM